MSCAQFFAVTARHRFVVAARKLRAIVILVQQTGTRVAANPKTALSAGITALLLNFQQTDLKECSIENETVM
jgi:hypothetical protein